MTDRSLRDALDLPPEAQGLQDAYWQAKAEWETLSAAYDTALRDLLARLGHNVALAPVTGASTARSADGELREALYDGIANLDGFAALTTPEGALAAVNLNAGETWLITIHPSHLEVDGG